VLRKNGDFFELLGECYVHGYMFGKAFKPISKCDDTRKRVVQNGTVGTSKSPSIAAGEEMRTKASKEQPHTVGENDLPSGWVHGFDIEAGGSMFVYPDQLRLSVTRELARREVPCLPDGLVGIVASMAQGGTPNHSLLT
jgi:hypothetical protein